MNPTSPEMQARRPPLRTLLAAAAVIVSVAAAMIAAPLAGAQTQQFSDPAGDVAAGTPDVTAVSVSESSDGAAYTFTAQIANATYAADFFLYLYIDTNGDDHAEYLVRLLGSDNRIELERWNGSGWDPSTAATLEGTSSLSPETVTLGRADIAGAQSFHFWLQAWKYVQGSQPACCFDYAGVFAYAGSSGTGSTPGTSGTGSGSSGSGGGTATATLPPPPPPPPFEAPASAPGGGGGSAATGTSTGSSGSSGTSGTQAGAGTAAGAGTSAAAPRVTATAPRRLRAGRPFTVTVRVLPTPAVRARVVCSASASGRSVGAFSAALVNGRAACVLRLAGSTRGKRVQIDVEVSVGTTVLRTVLSRWVR